MEQNTEENTQMGRKMGLEFTGGLMELAFKASGKII